jgi:hypothetical protein
MFGLTSPKLSIGTIFSKRKTSPKNKVIPHGLLISNKVGFSLSPVAAFKFNQKESLNFQILTLSIR